MKNFNSLVLVGLVSAGCVLAGASQENIIGGSIVQRTAIQTASKAASLKIDFNTCRIVYLDPSERTEICTIELTISEGSTSTVRDIIVAGTPGSTRSKIHDIQGQFESARNKHSRIRILFSRDQEGAEIIESIEGVSVN